MLVYIKILLQTLTYILDKILSGKQYWQRSRAFMHMKSYHLSQAPMDWFELIEYVIYTVDKKVMAFVEE